MVTRPSHPKPILTEDVTLTGPGGTPLPLAYRWLRAHGLASLSPWYFIDDPSKAENLRAEYLRETAPPNGADVRDLVPFARKHGLDEIAGFVVRNGAITEQVCIVHLTFSAQSEPDGWPRQSIYEDLWDWLKNGLIDETREVASEVALALLLKPR